MSLIRFFRSRGGALVAPFILLASLGLSTAGAAPPQPGAFEITGVLPAEHNGGKVTVSGYDGKEIASGVVADGRFTVQGAVTEVQRALLHSGKLRAEFVLEPARYQAAVAVTGLRVDGGEYNDQVYGYLKLPQLVDAVTSLKKFQEEAFAPGRTPEELDKARAESSARYKVIWALKDDHQEKILTGSGPALLKVLVLSNSEDWKRYPIAKRLELLDEYRKSLGAHPMIVALRENYADQTKTEQVVASLAPGRPFVDITVQDVSGKSARLSDVLAKNKLVLLDFWASWCGPCRAEFPYLKKVHERYSGKGFAIYSVSLDTSQKALRTALEEEKLPWATYSDLKGSDGVGAKTYAVTGLPSNYLIGGDGVIVGVQLRGDALEQAVRGKLGD